MTVEQIIARVKELEADKIAALERQSLAGKDARQVQKQIDEMNGLMMKAVLAERSPSLTQTEPMFTEPPMFTEHQPEKPNKKQK